MNWRSTFVLKVLIFCLQPENILLDNSLNVKITDFGFAKILLNDQKLYGRLIDTLFFTF